VTAGSCYASAVLRDEEVVRYPVRDDAGSSSLQVFVRRTLIASLEAFFAAAGRQVFVGGNQFMYYRRGEPGCVVAPDVYVLADEALPPWGVPCWKTWEHGGKAPTFALEIVADGPRKGYEERMVERYEGLGVRELIRYEPDIHAGRATFTQYVRDADGRLVERAVARDRVRSAIHAFWLVHRDQDLLRLAVGPNGGALWPTARERLSALRGR
jgi:YD repeat-containing protein